MCSSKVVLLKLNKIFALMLDGKLRRDIDDSLLDKLLDYLKSGSFKVPKTNQPECGTEDLMERADFFGQLLKETKVELLFQQAIDSVQKSNDQLPPRITSFLIHLLGIFLENKHVFLSYSNSSVVQSFFSICGTSDTVKCSPSIQYSIVCCMTSIIKHYDGFMWLATKNMTSFAFSSFNSTSYYVRQSAAQFFSKFFISWCSSEISLLTDSKKNYADSAVKCIIEQIICGIQENGLCSSVSDGYIMALKLAFQKDTMKIILCKDFLLLKRISHCFENLEENPSEISLEFCVDCIFSSGLSDEAIPSSILKSLLDKHLFVSAVHFVLYYLNVTGHSISLNVGQLQFLLLPLKLLGNALSPMNSDLAGKYEGFLQVPWDLSSTTAVSELKKTKTTLLTTSLAALTKLVPMMNSEAVSYVTKLVIEMMSGNTDPNLWLTVADTKVQLSALHLISSVLEVPVYSRLKQEVKTSLFEALGALLIIPCGFINSFVEITKLLQSTLSRPCDFLTDEMRLNFLKRIERRLFDERWEVVHGCLEIVGQMISGKDSKEWEEQVKKQSLHFIIWDFAIKLIPCADSSYVRASALRVAIDACLQPAYWESFVSDRGVKEVEALDMLYGNYKDSDDLVKQECITSLFHWLKRFHLHSKIQYKVFFMLTDTILHCEDWESRQTSLNAWEWLVENPKYRKSIFPDFDLTELLKCLCTVGYGLSLLHAIEDEHASIKFQAAQMLFKLRSKCLADGHSKESLTFDHLEVELEEEFVNNESVEENYMAVDEETKNEAIEIVVNMSMLQRIQNLGNHTNTRFEKSANLSEDKFACSIESFYKSLWSENIDLILIGSKLSSSLYESNPCALLDDIIAANVDMLPNYQSADCY